MPNYQDRRKSLKNDLFFFANFQKIFSYFWTMDNGHLGGVVVPPKKHIFSRFYISFLRYG